jgi:hypothetical protein
MTCKKCGAQMRLWLMRPSFKSFACPGCDFVVIVPDEAEGELSSAAVDAGWPHQVALPADLCTGRSTDVIREFC